MRIRLPLAGLPSPSFSLAGLALPRLRNGLGRLPILPLALAAALAATDPVLAQGVGLEVGSTVSGSVLLEDLDGNEVDLANLMDEGKPVLLEFWATWCEQCEALQPQMDRVQAEFGDRVNVVVVAVAVSQSPRRIRRHLERHDPGYPHLYDAKGNAVRVFNAATTAIVVIVDAEGTVTYSGVGADQDLVAAVREVIASAPTAGTVSDSR